MGKGTTKGSAVWTKTLDDGRVGCWSVGCTTAATRWIDTERYGNRKWLTTSYCDDHGDWQLDDPHHAMRIRKIKES